MEHRLLFFSKKNVESVETQNSAEKSEKNGQAKVHDRIQNAPNNVKKAIESRVKKLRPTPKPPSPPPPPQFKGEPNSSVARDIEFFNSIVELKAGIERDETRIANKFVESGNLPPAPSIKPKTQNSSSLPPPPPNPNLTKSSESKPKKFDSRSKLRRSRPVRRKKLQNES